jgi:hypothetical protein
MKRKAIAWRFFSVNQVFNMTTIMSGSFFTTNFDVVDYSTAHILSYLVAGLNDNDLNSIIVCGFFREIFCLWNPQRK